MEIKVTVDSGLPATLEEPVVAFGSFEGTRAGLVIYSPGSPSPLSKLYVDLICGRSLPLTLVMRSVGDLQSIVAAALFMDRELTLHPGAASLVTSVELVTSLGEGGLAHVGRDLARLLVFVERYVSTAPPGREELGRRLGQAVRWLGDYVTDERLPSLPPAPELPLILSRGTNGFVVAEASGSLVEAVVELYRGGHLRGVVFAPASQGRIKVLAFKKSLYLAFDLERAAHHLNQAEAKLGRSGGWKIEDSLLFGPPRGTIVTRKDVVETLLRV